MSWRLAAGHDVGVALAQARKQAGLSQQETAEWAGLRRQYISELESGEGSLQIQRLLELFAVLSCEVVVVPVGAPAEIPRV